MIDLVFLKRISPIWYRIVSYRYRHLYLLLTTPYNIVKLAMTKAFFKSTIS
jgi:hypothetical protein